MPLPINKLVINKLLRSKKAPAKLLIVVVLTIISKTYNV